MLNDSNFIITKTYWQSWKHQKRIPSWTALNQHDTKLNTYQVLSKLRINKAKNTKKLATLIAEKLHWKYFLKTNTKYYRQIIGVCIHLYTAVCFHPLQVVSILSPQLKTSFDLWLQYWYCWFKIHKWLPWSEIFETIVHMVLHLKMFSKPQHSRTSWDSSVVIPSKWRECYHTICVFAYIFFGVWIIMLRII